jgi:hypothetical protein
MAIPGLQQPRALFLNRPANSVTGSMGDCRKIMVHKKENDVNGRRILSSTNISKQIPSLYLWEVFSSGSLCGLPGLGDSHPARLLFCPMPDCGTFISDRSMHRFETSEILIDFWPSTREDENGLSKNQKLISMIIIITLFFLKKFKTQAVRWLIISC